MIHLHFHVRAWALLLLMPLISCTPAKPGHTASPEPTDAVDEDIRQLATPKGKVEYHGFINPGGPILESSEPMKRLAARGPSLQPRLLEELKSGAIRNEVALILEEVGDRNALLPMIDLLPTKHNLDEHEAFSTTCLLRALWVLTGHPIGINSKWHEDYTPEVRNRWLAWYGSNKDYLYTPAKPLQPTNARNPVVRVDFEAKIAAVPTNAYRQDHPWIHFDDIRTWQDGPAYETKLRSYCFTTNLNTEYGRAAPSAFGFIGDPRATTLLHRMCEMEDFTTADRQLMEALAVKGDPSSIPFLEKLKPSTEIPANKEYYEGNRSRAIESIRLVNKYRDALKDKPLDFEERVNYTRCLEGMPGIQIVLAELRNPNHDCFFSSYAHVASYVDAEPIRACLKEIALDDKRIETTRTVAHAALARLGDKDSLEHLRRSLAHKNPGVRLAAAEGLWRSGNREGFKTLLGLLEVGPLETGGEGNSATPGSFKVERINEPKVEIIRSACRILGEMGDPAAIEPLKRVLSLNLNGILGNDVGSGTGWGGRPDVVALARLGDLSGLPLLGKAARDGDRLDVIGDSWHNGGDFVAVGLKRFIPDILPLLEARDENKRIDAAKEILLLLERGR